MVSGCGRVLVRSCGLFVVFGVFVLGSPLPLVLRSGDVGYGSRRFGRHAPLGMALLPIVPTYSRGSGDIVVMQYVDYCKAWLTCVVSLVRL